MADWVTRESISDPKALTITENNGSRTTLYTRTKTWYEFNTKTGEIRSPGPSSINVPGNPGLYNVTYTEVSSDPTGLSIFNRAQSINPDNVIDDRVTGKKYVAQAEVLNDGSGKAFIRESGPWVGASIKNNIANWKNGKPADWTNNVLAIANQEVRTDAFNEAQAKGIDTVKNPNQIGGNLGLSRSSNPPRPDPAQPGSTPGGGNAGDNSPDTSPVIDFSGASLTDIGTPNSASYFPPEVANNTLRYPYHIISASTDYLQISIETYNRGFAPDKAAELTRATNDPRFKSKEGVKGGIGTIILPIPSNIQDGNSVGYSDGTLDSLTGAVIGGALGVMGAQGDTTNAVVEKMKTEAKNAFAGATESGLKGQILRSLAVQAASIIPGAGNVTPEQLLARQTGGILNPNMELLFNGVTLRSFKFSFKMTPRSKTEADEIKKIIRTLKINMAPQTLTNDNFLRTPNVFQLQYMTGPQPHAFLHRFKTCALTDMSVNYTGEGIYATYNDATPNSMIMDLTFKELEPIYNTDYEGVGGVGY